MAASARVEAFDQVQTVLGMAMMLNAQGETDAAARSLTLLLEKMAVTGTSGHARLEGLEMEALFMLAGIKHSGAQEAGEKLAAKLREHCARTRTALKEGRVQEAVVLANLILPAARMASDLDQALPKPAQGEMDLLNTVRSVAVDWFHTGRAQRPLAKSFFEALLPQVTARNDHPATRDVCHFLASILRDENQHVKSLELRQLLDGHLRQRYGPEHKETIFNRLEMGESLHQTGQRNEAADLTADCLKILEKTLGKEHRETLRCRETLVGRLSAANRKEEGLLLNQEQKQLALKEAVSYPGAYAMALVKEGNILRDLGQWTRARESYEEALAKVPLEAPNEGDRARLQGIIHGAIHGLESVAKAAGLPFQRPKAPLLRVKPEGLGGKGG
jgi:tetratricopeptide (TPR) repeat protein